MSWLLLHVFNYAKKKKTTVFPFKEKCTAGSNLEIRIDSPYICKIKQVHQKKNAQLCFHFSKWLLAGVLQTVIRQPFVYFK